MELIENRGIHLGSLCTAHKEESIRITQAVRNFIEQYETVDFPLTSFTIPLLPYLIIICLKVSLSFSFHHSLRIFLI